MQILPVLETAGLIYQEQDTSDKRKVLIFPSSLYLQRYYLENNGVNECGVDNLENNIDQYELDNI